MSAEEVGHSAVGLDSVPKRGTRSEPIEEGEERRRGKKVGVVVDEIDNMIGCK